MEETQQWMDMAIELATVYGVQLLAALAIVLVGRMVAGWLRRLVERLLTKGRTDPMIVSFVSSIAYFSMMAFVVLAALGQVGIQTTSFIAVLGAAGLAIGLALQGSLANFAAGFLLTVFRPFKVGDYIEGAGVAGVVDSIHIFTTTLKTGDNKTIIVPNAKLSNDNIVNYSTQATRRVDMTVGVSYDADIHLVRQTLQAIIAAEARVLTEPSSLIAISALADNSVNFVVRVWVKSSDYWGVYFAMNEQIKLRFDAEGIGIPYPQRDVHLYEHKVA